MKNQTRKIKSLLETETPFSIIQYFESFKGSKKETRKVYELLTISKDKDRIIGTILDSETVSFIKRNKEIKQIINTIDGSVFEFNFFKKKVKDLGLEA